MSGKCPQCLVTYIVLARHKCAMKVGQETTQEKIDRLIEENAHLKSYNEMLICENQMLRNCLLERAGKGEEFCMDDFKLLATS
jgi:hypothetical protein